MQCRLIQIFVLLLMLMPQPRLSVRVRVKRRESHMARNHTSIGKAANTGGKYGDDQDSTDTNTTLAHETILIAIRHGESVGNIFSDSIKKAKGMAKWLKQAYHAVRLAYNMKTRKSYPGKWYGKDTYAFWDSPLSGTGVATMQSLGKKLFGQERDQDVYDIFAEERVRDGVTVMFSPLRRTISTMIEVVGIPIQKIGKSAGIRFKAEPYAHERQDSLSDVGSSTTDILEYLANEWDRATTAAKMTPANNSVLTKMSDSIATLNDEWFKDVRYYQDKPALEKGTHDDESGPGKEDDNFGLGHEDIFFFSNRMHELMQKIREDESKLIILVAHSKVIQFLFKDFLSGNMKVENGGVLVGTFSNINPEYSYGRNWKLNCTGITKDRRFPFSGKLTGEVEFLTPRIEKDEIRDNYEEGLLHAMADFRDQYNTVGSDPGQLFQDISDSDYQVGGKVEQKKEKLSEFSKENFDNQLRQEKNNFYQAAKEKKLKARSEISS